MEYIKVTMDNIDQQHICCAISNNNDIQVASKKNWLKQRFDDGLVFLKSVDRGKCFIEYIPSENAFIPIEADGYMYINCLWVAGSFKGHGYSNDLLNYCIQDSKNKGKKGLCILSSERKRPFLADPKYLKYKGFILADETDYHIHLYYLPFDKNSLPVKFKNCCKHPNISDMGYVLYYSHQCPFNAKYVPIITEIANERNIPFKAILIDDKIQAQNAPTAITTYSLFYNGEFLTNQQFNDKSFIKLIEKNS